MEPLFVLIYLDDSKCLLEICFASFIMVFVINIPIVRTPSTCQLYMVNDVYLQNIMSYLRY